MQRRGFDLPLLIGGATTSPAHTAVKIEPNYEGPVIYVKDASRSVGIAQALVTENARAELVRKTREDNGGGASDIRQVPPGTADVARGRTRQPLRADWASYSPPAPAFTGRQVMDHVDLALLKDYIDWMPFFNAWEFHGRYPAILSDKVVGDAARRLFSDASVMLDRIIKERWLEARAVLGFFPANSIDNDDIRLFGDDDRTRELMRLCHLRQQRGKPDGQPHHCLADFVAPAESGVADYVGGFAVTAGIGIDEHVERFERAHDDYSSILLKALADRLAEALAEYLHVRVRREFWGYAADESLGNDDLIAEKYRGIRPAPGYPACPDHTEKAKLWQLLDVEAAIGLRLTESFAMFPTAAVSGFYFAHPDSRYFSVGKVSRDQVESWAARKGMTMAEAERWLSPNLGYDPAEADAA